MVFLYCLLRKKFDRILTKAKAIIPYPKNIKASDVILTSLEVKEPYPNNPFTISSEAIMRPKLAGIESSSDN